jgi:hypothetical protein
MEDRAHELVHVGAFVLVVAIGVDDHIRPQLQRGVQSSLKG